MNKHIDCSWSEPIEEDVCDEIQTVLDKADGTPPIVENPDSLDFEIGDDMLRPYRFSCSGILHPEVITDADMVLDSISVEPLETFVTDELPVCDQAFDTITSKQADEPLNNIDSLLAVGVPELGQEAEQGWKQHLIIRYALNSYIDIHLSGLQFVRSIIRVYVPENGMRDFRYLATASWSRTICANSPSFCEAITLAHMYPNEPPPKKHVFIYLVFFKRQPVLKTIPRI